MGIYEGLANVFPARKVYKKGKVRKQTGKRKERRKMIHVGAQVKLTLPQRKRRTIGVDKKRGPRRVNFGLSIE